MKGKSGSIVAIEPSSGEILSLVSGPSYDPNLLTGRSYSSNFKLISNDTLKPLFNRPLMAQYRPGSIFKIAQAILRGDQEEAERLTGAHLDEAYRFFLIKLEEERREKPDITF